MSEFDYSLHYARWHENSPEYFEQQAHAFDSWLSPSLEGLPADSRILDYGCGFGLLSYYLRKRFDCVASVDSSAEQIAIAKSRGLNAAVVAIEEFESWTTAHCRCFDVIFLFDVLEHIPVGGQIKFLSLLRSTLSEKGCIFLKVPNANSMLASRWRYIDWTHTCSFTEASLDFVCLNAGLDNITYLPDDSSARPRLPWLLRPGLIRYHLRNLFRWLWKLYLFTELGEQAKTISVGYNLFARCTPRHVE